MSLKLDSKQDQAPGPFAPQGKDLDRVLAKKRRPDQAEEAAAESSPLAASGGPAQSQESKAAAADLGTMWSEPAAEVAPPPPKLSLPYLPTKPNKNAKRNAAQADDPLRPADPSAAGAPSASPNKEQGFT